MRLRDDLFLDRGHQRRPGDPPAVVRAYEWCDHAGAGAEAALRTEDNATRGIRAARAADPLPIVAAIFFGTHLERLSLLRVYESYFARVVYMSLSAEITKLVHGGRKRAVRGRAHAYHCRHGLKATYACVAEVALAHATGLEGTLYLHFDLWIKPWELLHHLATPATATVAATAGMAAMEASSPERRLMRWRLRRLVQSAPAQSAPAPSTGRAAAELLRTVWALPAERIMLKQGGPTRLLPLECFNASRPSTYRGAYPEWTWERDLPPSLRGLHHACAGGRRCATDRLCIGWADLYYVPAQQQEAFSTLARGFVAHSANAELAVPTMLHVLAERQGTPLRRPSCWGYCCSSTSCPELLLRHPCGHRMSLADGRMREAFGRLWQAPP